MAEQDPTLWTPRSRAAVSSLARAWRALSVMTFCFGSLSLLATTAGMYVVTDLYGDEFTVGVGAVVALGIISIFAIGVSQVLASAVRNMRSAQDDEPDMFNLHVTAGLADIQRYWFWATASIAALAATAGASALWMLMG